jgi:hypothetical protein
MKFLMKIFTAILFLTLLIPHCLADAAADKQINAQLSAFLQELDKLKPGSTRAELLKHFTPDGGLQQPPKDERLISIRFNDIKVDVKFNLTTPDQKTELPTDTIRTISRPYLELPALD